MSKGGKVFTGLTIVFALVCLTFLIRFDKSSIHMAMENWHVDTAPFLFKYLTHLGDGLMFVVVTIVLLALRSKGAVVLSTVSSGVSILVLVGVLKQFVFPDVDRPWGWFEEGTLRMIEGIDQHTHHSFPSGHTTAAFGLFGLMAFWVNRKWASVLFFLVALLVGYSRIYLNQHFLIDVFVGSVLGTTIAWINYYLFSGMSHPRLRKRLL